MRVMLFDALGDDAVQRRSLALERLARLHELDDGAKSQPGQRQWNP